MKDTWDETVDKPHKEALKVWAEESAKAKLAGQALPPKPELASKAPAPPMSPEGSQNKETTLLNAMLNPLILYAIKGAIWYRGESNATQARFYQTLFPAMIADWRTRWNQGDFPFLFVQIAPFNKQPPEIREAQFLTLSKSPKTAMAVTTDVGDANDIHPTRKEPVGQRLALAARALAYGEKIEYSGPLYQSKKDSPLRHSAQTSIDAGSASHAILPITGLLGFRAESEHPLPPKGGRCSSQDRTKALAHARLPASFQR